MIKPSTDKFSLNNDPRQLIISEELLRVTSILNREVLEYERISGRRQAATADRLVFEGQKRLLLSRSANRQMIADDIQFRFEFIDPCGQFDFRLR